MVSSATELLTLIENTLGCTPPPVPGKPAWAARVAAAGRINKAIEKKPQLYTWANLEATVSYLRAKHIQVRSPAGIFFFVEDALKVTADTEPVKDLDQRIDDAIAWEHERHLPGWADWLDRLIRAYGPAREATWAEWKQARRP